MLTWKYENTFQVTDAEVEEAARIANAHDFIELLESGYDTLLGPDGVALSGEKPAFRPGPRESESHRWSKAANRNCSCYRDESTNSSTR